MLNSTLKHLCFIMIFLMFFSLTACQPEYLNVIRYPEKTAEIVSLSRIAGVTGLIPAEKQQNGSDQNQQDILPEKIQKEVEIAIAEEKEAEKQKILERGEIQDYYFSYEPEKNERFTVNLELPGNHLANIEELNGDVRLVEKNRDVFDFKAGVKDSRIIFKVYHIDGYPLRKIHYFIDVKDNMENELENIRQYENSAVEDSSKQETIEKEEDEDTDRQEALKEEDQSPEAESAEESIQEEQAGEAVTDDEFTGNDRSVSIIYSLERLPDIMAVKEARENLESRDLTQEEKEKIRYFYISKLIGISEYTDAEIEIRKINEPAHQSYYNGMLELAKKKYQNALTSFLNALEKSLDQEMNQLSRDTLIALEKTMIKGALFDNNLILLIEDKADQLSAGDVDFEFEAKMLLSDIYISVLQAYQAKDVLKTVNSDLLSEKQQEQLEDKLSMIQNQYIDYQ